MKTIQVVLKIKVQDGDPSITFAFEVNAKHLAEHGWDQSCQHMETELIRRFKAILETSVKPRVVKNRRNLSVVTTGINLSHKGDSNG